MSEERKKHKSSDTPELPELMSMPGELRITAEGDWLHDGEKFTHKNVQQYFASRIRLRPELGGYVVEVNGKCVPVVVEDTAYFVRTIRTESWPWMLVLGEQEEEPMRALPLEIDETGVFYFRLASGELARALRPAWQAIVSFVEESRPGEFVLVTPIGRIEIKRRAKT